MRINSNFEFVNMKTHVQIPCFQQAKIIQKIKKKNNKIYKSYKKIHLLVVPAVKFKLWFQYIQILQKIVLESLPNLKFKFRLEVLINDLFHQLIQKANEEQKLFVSVIKE